jgi:hypothetical protein
MHPSGDSTQASATPQEAAHAAIRWLLRRLGGGSISLEGILAIPSTAIPEPGRSLLGHTDHMTETLARHYVGRPGLVVNDCRVDGRDYSRRIALTFAGKVIQHALMHVDLSLLPSAVADAIREQKLPLGEVLIRHRVATRVRPCGFVELEPGCPLLRWLGEPASGKLYGRFAEIDCDGSPAIEVLEILTGIERPGP